MNVNIARTYFDKNGYIFIVTNSTRWKGEVTISITKYDDFDLAYERFKKEPTAEFCNLTQAKMKGWYE